MVESKYVITQIISLSKIYVSLSQPLNITLREETLNEERK